MSNMPSWWKQWRDFMFNTKITVPGRKGGAPVEQWRDFKFNNKITIPGRKGGAPVEQVPSEMLQPIMKSKYPDVPSEMLQPIMKSKYPDITEEEQAISIPLQTS
ncbi:hypothetical protein T484DRAFT_1810809 [Baffinella frigidus]|nr:hypothetical protein T484DRAFT_1810809 [Cryptophyta sp. CCMP2293]